MPDAEPYATRSRPAEISDWLTRDPSSGNGWTHIIYSATDKCRWLSVLCPWWMSLWCYYQYCSLLVASLQWIYQQWYRYVRPTANHKEQIRWWYHKSLRLSSNHIISDHLLPRNPPTPWFLHHSSWIYSKSLSRQNENVYLWPVKATEDRDRITVTI